MGLFYLDLFLSYRKNQEMEERKNQVISYRLFVGNNNNNLVDQISSSLPIVKV